MGPNQTQTRRRKKVKLSEIELTERIKTISWKFRDVAESYPEIESVKNVKISHPGIFYDMFKFLFDHETKEKFIVFWLNAANKILGFEVVSEGNLISSVVHPREVFRSAIVSSCNGILLTHNHPSGNIEPSQDDISITRKLVSTGNIIDIKVLDHIIFTNNSFYSFVEHGLLRMR